MGKSKPKQTGKTYSKGTMQPKKMKGKKTRYLG